MPTRVKSKILNIKEPTLKYKSNAYPIVADGLPKPYWVSMFVGSRQSGKTYTCAKLIRQYEETGVFNPDSRKAMAIRTIIISPTFDANPVFNSLESLDEEDVYTVYSDGILQMIVQDIDQEKNNTIAYHKQMEVWSRFVKAQDVDKMSDHDIIELERMAFSEPMPCKYPNGVFNILILDDLVGSGAFKAGKSYLTNVVLKNRHLGMNICILSQSMKSIPKPIRVNTSIFVLFKYANQRIVLEDVYEEISGKATQNDFLEFFDYATTQDHGSLVLDFTGKKDEVFKNGFNEILSLQ
jgi:hypothetical protein